MISLYLLSLCSFLVLVFLCTSTNTFAADSTVDDSRPLLDALAHEASSLKGAGPDSRANDGKRRVSRGANGGFQCATCVILLGLVERWSVYNNASVEHGLIKFCKLVPNKIQKMCRIIVQLFGPPIVQSIILNHSPESICHNLKLCLMDDPSQPQCVLFHQSKSKPEKKKRGRRSKSLPVYQSFHRSISSNRNKFQRLVVDDLQLVSPHNFGWSFCNLPYIKNFCEELERIFRHHEAANDKDSDSFSTTKTLRGTSWRGRDCDDVDPDIHPGRKARDGDVDVDANCNGIFGRPENGEESYEEKFCAGSKTLGVAMLGDSAGAHFHMPEAWFDPTQLSDAVLTNGSFIIENEGDWPQLSSSTGYLSSTEYFPFITGPVDSVYERLRRRNRCNHRDFQNLAVNGANSNDTLINMRLLNRNSSTDNPLLVFYAMNGNDVCNWHKDTIPYMSSTKVVTDNLLKTLEFLNATVPRGSHVIVMGMPDGRFLWNNVHHRIHPLGRLWNDVRYKDVYGFWNCLEISPCYGWLNEDENIRNLTQERADNITLALWQTVQEQRHKWRNIDVTMEESPLFSVASEWVGVGGKVWQLIEPVDGFHPNQYAMALFGRSMWKKLEKYYPELVGKINPFNEEIEKVFGDQGGY